MPRWIWQVLAAYQAFNYIELIYEFNKLQIINGNITCSQAQILQFDYQGP